MGQGRFQGSSGHVPQRPGHRATLVRRARPKRHERVGGGRRRRDEEVLKHLEIHIVPAVLPFSCPRFSGSWIYLIGTIRINLILVQILPKNNPRTSNIFGTKIYWVWSDEYWSNWKWYNWREKRGLETQRVNLINFWWPLQGQVWPYCQVQGRLSGDPRSVGAYQFSLFFLVSCSEIAETLHLLAVCISFSQFAVGDARILPEKKNRIKDESISIV